MSIEHIGIIMDGNRRWAKNKGLLSFQGHDNGASVFVDTCDWCIQENIKYLTVYAFSTENWNRSQEEVFHIFNLLERFFNERLKQCLENDIKIKIIGNKSKFSKKTLAIIENAEMQTRKCKKLSVQIALSYGGRDEIIRAVKKIAADVINGKRTVKGITEKIFESYLDTSGVPDIDLVIRTGGNENRRLSNFLPWQTVYSELYFSELMWPEFSRKEFNNAIKYYYSVVRKKGN